MDNHFHLFVHVSPVPKRCWLDPDDEPAAYAFGMRPPECREPLWSPRGDCPPSPYSGVVEKDAVVKAVVAAYVGRDADFLGRVAGFLPKRFPRAGMRSVRRCRAFVWELPRPGLLKSAA